MSQTAVNADSMLDLWAYLIVGLPGLIGSVIAAVIGWKSRASHKQLHQETTEIREQVSNDHKTNLRDDLDLVRSDIRSVAGSVRDLHADITKIDNRTSRIGDEINVDRSALHDLRREVYSALSHMDKVLEKHHPEDARPHD